MIKRSIGLNMLFTRYMTERDALSACMTRFGSGFFPRGEINEARKLVKSISDMIDDFEMAQCFPKDSEIIIKSINQNGQQSVLK